jgi:hypothetical protein
MVIQNSSRRAAHRLVLFLRVRIVDVNWPRSQPLARMRWIRSFIIEAIGIALVIGSLTLTVGRIRSPFSRGSVSDSTASSRWVVLWAWERPTDLRFITQQNFGVAFLARSILVESGKVSVKPRLQPLRLPPSVTVIAVARIETDRKRRPELSGVQVDQVARTIVEMAALPNVNEVQIDFDAIESERSFYRELLTKVRQQLPQGRRLSITALASWCMDDDWIGDLPVDEAVPMLFRMAADGKHIANRLDAGDDFREPLCRQSYGVSLDESRPQLVPSRRLYVFNPDAWSESSVREILESR